MKTLTCSDLGGPASCDHEFTASSFDDLEAQSQAHVMEMINNGDADHQEAVNRMKTASPEDREAMMTEFKKKFEEAKEA